MRKRILPSTFIATLAAISAMGLGPAASAHAPDWGGAYDGWLWGKCNQRGRLFQGDITVSQTYTLANRFPEDSYYDGIKNSFTDRLRGAITSWERALRSPSGAGVPGHIRYVGRTNDAHVVVSYEELGNDVTGVADVRSECADSHANPRQLMPSTSLNAPYLKIRIDRAPDWFTRGDDHRRNWEECRISYHNAYTCGKLYDVEWTMAHELGHAFGLTDFSHLTDHLIEVRHPNPTFPIGRDGKVWAKCGNNSDWRTQTDAATMCGISTHNSAGRTLMAYDLDSLYLNTR